MSNNTSFEELTSKQEAIKATLRKAAKKVAPVWPLENFVAVNPYLGHTEKTFEHVAQELAAAGGIQMTMPASFYLQKFQEGKITEDDLAIALQKRKPEMDVNEFIRTLEVKPDELDETYTLATIADIATQVTGKDWNRFVISRVSTWAASYFDKGQALWMAANQNHGVFESWIAEAEVDRTPEISGLSGFRNRVKALPNHPLEAAQVALNKLKIPEEGVDLYLHRILLRVGGWSAYAAQLDWDNELYGGNDGKVIEFLSILICWEACLLESLHNDALESQWKKAKGLLAISNFPKKLNQQLEQKLTLQEAYDLATQRQLVFKFRETESKKKSNLQAKAQAVFCIDVRSEVYRRNLERVDESIETLGFAGFFAFPIKYVPLGHEVGEAQCPVLLTTGPTILEEIHEERANQRVYNRRVLNRQVQQVWKSFKSGAVSCFSFVSPVGLSFLPKLFTDSFGLTRPVPHPNANGISNALSTRLSISLVDKIHHGEKVGIPLDQQIKMAKNALTAMSLTDNFSDFILIVGHGSTMVNNAHSTGYDCGACGGHTGEANARVVASVLNNPKVREGLRIENVVIPSKTVFLACLHDTTTDELKIFNPQDVPKDCYEEFQSLKRSLELAGHASRTERLLRMSEGPNLDIEKSILARSKDWSQIRPEWGLAGCSAFVVAPRERTQGINLEGRSFLHSYDWKKDKGFSVLELIMTAPMVVTTWINLQYYGSTVDNRNLGSGNKTLHNVTAGVGVLEGYSGDLRVGLPQQAIHDGENFQHEPLRLQVVIEAPIDAMNVILEKHKAVRDLCDNGWMYLLAMDENGHISHRYKGQLYWEKLNRVAA